MVAEVPDTVDAALDALSSPTSFEVELGTRSFSARSLAAAAARRAMEGGGGGGGLPDGWTQDGDPADVSTNGGSLRLPDPGGVVVGDPEAAFTELDPGSMTLTDSSGATVFEASDAGARSAPSNDASAFTAQNTNGATIALDGGGLLVSNLAEGVDPTDAATVSQLGGGGLPDPIVDTVTIAPDTANELALEVFPNPGTDDGGDVVVFYDLAGAKASVYDTDGSYHAFLADARPTATLDRLGRITIAGHTDGGLATGSYQLYIAYNDSPTFKIRAPGLGSIATIGGGAPGDVMLELDPATAQTADIIGVYDENYDRFRFRINKGAYPVVSNNAAPADGDLSANDCAMWFDSTNGAAKVMFKGKSADGTVVAGEVALT